MFAGRLVCGWIVVSGLAAGAFCQSYIQFSVVEGEPTSPNSINQKGEIAGSYGKASNSSRGFVRRRGGMIESFDVPGSSGTFASSITFEGAITGYFNDGRDARGSCRACLE